MRLRLVSRLLRILSLFAVASAASAESHLNIVVSVPEQRLYVFNHEGDEVCHYSISTSKYGVGDSRGSYSTPLGQLEVASKIGSGALAGTVFKSCSRTGEICPVNARGRDPIVTRILWLRGKEAQNASAYNRRIYIHGTPDEAHIGRPASYGCIRMRSRDVIALYETVEVGTTVEITRDRVGGGMFAKAHHAPAQIIAMTPTTPAKGKKGAAASAVAVASASKELPPAVGGGPASAKSKKTVASARPVATPKAAASEKPAVAANTAVPTKPIASADVAVSSSTKSKTLSLSEPLIGTDSSESKTGAAKKKSVASVSGRKNRS